MKKLAKLSALVLALSLSVGLTAGCNKQVVGDQYTIQLYMWDSGLGTDWMEEIIEDFNASQDTYTVLPEYTSAASAIISTLSLGTGNQYDLYFTMLNTMQYNEDFLDLSDFIKETLPGENASIKSKYYPDLLDGMYNADDTINTLSYGNCWCGILYNKTMISEDELPRTTDELADLSAEIGSQKAWLFYNDKYNNGYWNYVTYVWEAQYDGLDYYNNTMMQLKDAAGNSPSKEVMLGTDKGTDANYYEKDGRYQALLAMESMLTSNTVNPSSTNQNFTTVQNLFLGGHAAMSIGGNWIMKEMSKVNEDIAMMKIPVISSITDKLEDTSMSDRELSAIVAEIDANPEATTSAAGLCSGNDYMRIKQARNLMYNNGTEMYVFIPEYSNCIEGAKEFLRYFYSDAGTLAYMNSTGLPASVRLTDESKFDVSKLSDWNQTAFEFTASLTPLVTRMDRADLFKDFGLNQYAGISTAQPLFKSNSDKRNAKQLWDEMIVSINENWSEWAA